jgi:hypothetical protein
MLFDTGSFLSFPVVRMGRRARDLLRLGALGQVAAVFARSIYLRSDAGAFACLGSLSIGTGPLNCLCEVPERMDFRANGPRLGSAFRVSKNLLRINGGFAFSMEGVETWRPQTATAEFSRRRLHGNLKALVATARSRLPAEGLGFLVGEDQKPATGNHVAAMAGPAVAQLKHWLQKRLEDKGHPPDPPNGAAALIGLGPGLTPSGDDFIGGLMIALRGLGKPGLAAELAAWALPLVRDQSGAISSAYLEAAATGEGAGAIHHVLEQLSSSERPDFTWTIGEIDRIGHTSGWDCLAGVTAVCRILSEQPETRKNCR